MQTKRELFLSSDLKPSSPSLKRPDIELKMYLDSRDVAEKQTTLQELKLSIGKGLVLHLAEDIHGNIFNKPFPFIHLRKITPFETLPKDLFHVSDPLKDYFFSLSSVSRDRTGENTLGYIFMGFKVLSNDKSAETLDESWHDWSGVRQLLEALDPSYDVRSVECWKAANSKQDVFKYCVLIKIGGEEDLIYARDCLQRFRIKRMSGYVAMYKEWKERDVDEAINKRHHAAVLSNRKM